MIMQSDLEIYNKLNDQNHLRKSKKNKRCAICGIKLTGKQIFFCKKCHILKKRIIRKFKNAKNNKNISDFPKNKICESVGCKEFSKCLINGKFYCLYHFKEKKQRKAK